MDKDFGGKSMSNRYAVILAAGIGSRMKSKLYKDLHRVCDKPMVQHVIDQLKPLNLNELITVVSFGAESVKEQLQDQTSYVTQEEQLGTGHAVQMAAPFLENKRGMTLVVYGDTPLLTSNTLQQLMEHHEKEQAKVSVLTANLNDPSGYGRIIRNSKVKLKKLLKIKTLQRMKN